MVMKQPFGVFVDIGEAYHALALVPHMYEDNRPIGIEDYPEIGTGVEGIILAFAENGIWSYVSIGSITVLDKKY